MTIQRQTLDMPEGCARSPAAYSTEHGGHRFVALVAASAGIEGDLAQRAVRATLQTVAERISPGRRAISPWRCPRS